MIELIRAVGLSILIALVGLCLMVAVAAYRRRARHRQRVVESSL